jgi:hypothetical protein
MSRQRRVGSVRVTRVQKAFERSALRMECLSQLVILVWRLEASTYGACVPCQEPIVEAEPGWTPVQRKKKGPKKDSAS